MIQIFFCYLHVYELMILIIKFSNCLMKYLFPIIQLRESHGAFRVLMDDYVTSESGTGIVHQAPYFGEVGVISTKGKYSII